MMHLVGMNGHDTRSAIPPRLAGLDGCPGGWAAATLDLSTGALEACFVEDLEPFVASCDLVLADVPIGLADVPRLADRAARAFLGRSSSVFPAPPRTCLAADAYPETCAAARAATGKAITLQTFHILPKIRAMDALLQARPDLRERVWECHPECSFKVWAGAPLPPKKRREGRDARQALIDGEFGSGTFARLWAAVRGQGPKADYLADAVAAVWSARRLWKGEAFGIPESAEIDGTGLRIQIVI